MRMELVLVLCALELEDAPKNATTQRGSPRLCASIPSTNTAVPLSDMLTLVAAMWATGTSTSSGSRLAPRGQIPMCPIAHRAA